MEIETMKGPWWVTTLAMKEDPRLDRVGLGKVLKRRFLSMIQVSEASRRALRDGKYTIARKAERRRRFRRAGRCGDQRKRRARRAANIGKV